MPQIQTTPPAQKQYDALLRQMYDMLMLEIEPDLTLLTIPHLDDMYDNEKPEERQERGRRYAAAFEKFEQQWQQFSGQWNGKLESMKQNILDHFRAEEENEQKASLANIDHFIQNT